MCYLGPERVKSYNFLLRFSQVKTRKIRKRIKQGRKAKWSHYIALTNKLARTLLPLDLLDVDVAYQDCCNIINKAAKKTI